MVDYDRLAETVLAKMPAPEAVDYDRLAETVLAKLPTPEAIDYEALSDMIFEIGEVAILGKVVGLMRNYRS